MLSIPRCVADLKNFHDVLEFKQQVLWKGISGTVQIASYKRTPLAFTAVAVKVVPDRSDSREYGNTARKEASILKDMQGHPNIVKFLDVFRCSEVNETQQQLQWALVFEYCTGGDLRKQVACKGRYSEAKSSWLSSELLSGVAHLRECSIVHRNVEPAHVLFGTCGTPVLADFGLAVRLNDPAVRITWGPGTPGYLAPEVLSGGDADCGFKVDVFSIGAVLCFCLSGRSPFHGDDTLSILRNTMQCRIRCDHTLQPLSPVCKAFMCKLLEREPQARPSARLSLKHQFLKQVWHGKQDMHSTCRSNATASEQFDKHVPPRRSSAPVPAQSRPEAANEIPRRSPAAHIAVDPKLGQVSLKAYRERFGVAHGVMPPANGGSQFLMSAKARKSAQCTKAVKFNDCEEPFRAVMFGSETLADSAAPFADHAVAPPCFMSDGGTPSEDRKMRKSFVQRLRQTFSMARRHSVEGK